MSDALNEPQAEASVHAQGSILQSSRNQRHGDASCLCIPDFGQGTGLDQTSATVPQSSAPADPMRGLSSGGSYRKQLPMSGLPPAGLIMVGLLTALLGAWAGLSVLVGPSFGWSPDGSPSWHWSLIHAALHVAPGGAALVAGVAMVAIVPKAARGAGRSGAALAGFWQSSPGRGSSSVRASGRYSSPPSRSCSRPPHHCAASPTLSAPTWDRAFFSQ